MREGILRPLLDGISEGITKSRCGTTEENGKLPGGDGGSLCLSRNTRWWKGELAARMKVFVCQDGVSSTVDPIWRFSKQYKTIERLVGCRRILRG